MRLVNAERSLLFAEFEPVPLDVSVRNEEFFSGGLHVVVCVA
jgi:hypothetical protein